MSPTTHEILGQPIAHVGYSVESIPRTVDFLVRTFGAGPFFLMENIRIPQLVNPNGPIVWHHSAAFGRWGGIVVELQQIDRLEPSNAFGPCYERAIGFNHVAYAVDDLAREDQRLRELGFELLFQAVNGPHESNLYNLPALGHTIEVHQAFDLFFEFHAGIAEAADGWNGERPLRPASADVLNAVANRGG